jgi:two-component system LytT family response regulator
MEVKKKIRTAIIDDDKEFLFSLQEHLLLFPEIEVVASATQYQKAKTILLREELDLIFLDIEIPGGSGFQLLKEVHDKGNNAFKVIFYTAYDKYSIQALRESAFDYLIKPIKAGELKNVIERFLSEKKKELHFPLIFDQKSNSEIIPIPTAVGLKFLEKNSIVFFQCTKESIVAKPSWSVLLNDLSQSKLKPGTTAKEILNYMGEKHFLQINQSTIVNSRYLNIIEFKTRKCFLVPPYDNIELTVSRFNMIKLKEQCDWL